MKLLVTKTCKGILDTGRERKRITGAFNDRPATMKKLLELMDAIEAGNWPLARKLLESKWWQGRDEELECPRAEFVGLLDLKEIDKPGEPAWGFDTFGSYCELVYAMTEPGLIGKYLVKTWIEPFKGTGNG